MEITKEMLDKTLTARFQRTGEIEQILFDMANGKLPLPSQQDCRVLALRLGTPKAEWSKQVKDHKWEGCAVYLRQVRADAGRAGFVEGVEWFLYNSDESTTKAIAADNYHASILAGKD